jgi:hypothetical protein
LVVEVVVLLLLVVLQLQPLLAQEVMEYHLALMAHQHFVLAVEVVELIIVQVLKLYHQAVTVVVVLVLMVQVLLEMEL